MSIHEISLPAGSSRCCASFPCRPTPTSTATSSAAGSCRRSTSPAASPRRGAPAGRVATVAVNAFQFKQPVMIGDVLSLLRRDRARRHAPRSPSTSRSTRSASRRAGDGEGHRGDADLRRDRRGPPAAGGAAGGMTAILGVDFTSAPRPRKADHGRPRSARGRRLRPRGDRTAPRLAGVRAVARGARSLDRRLRLSVRAAARGGASISVGRQEWARACRALRCARPLGAAHELDAYRAGRPAGRKYPHRATDLPAGSHSPIKLVNPPVALMFLEGAPRLARAGVTIPGLVAGDPRRVAVEAYPGLAARDHHPRLIQGGRDAEADAGAQARAHAIVKRSHARRWAVRFPAPRRAEALTLARRRCDRRQTRRGPRRDAGRVVPAAPRTQLGAAARRSIRSRAGSRPQHQGRTGGFWFHAPLNSRR